jgi:hypothetical protein
MLFSPGSFLKTLGFPSTMKPYIPCPQPNFTPQSQKLSVPSELSKKVAKKFGSLMKPNELPKRIGWGRDFKNSGSKNKVGGKTEKNKINE